jgi:hypothetical protein
MIRPLPAGLTVRGDMPPYTIARRWFSFVHVLTFVFSVFWNGFLVFWYAVLLKDVPFGGEAGWMALLPVLFPLLHVGAGIGLFYFSMAGFFNSTVIEVSGDALAVRHGPLPWPGNRKIRRTDLKQLYCEEKTTRNRTGVSVTYTLNAVLSNFHKLPLVRSLPEKDQAQYLESFIEEKMGIRD